MPSSPSPKSESRPELDQDQRDILAVLVADLPETARMMNDAAITEEIVFGRDHPALEDDELPEQEVYDRHTRALQSLEKSGLVTSAEVFGMTAFAATKAGTDA